MRILRKKPVEPSTDKFRRMESVLEDDATEIPGPVYEELKSHLSDATTAAKDEEEAALQQIALLGPSATAGIAAVAYQHELKKQFAFVEKIVVRLRKIKSGSDMLQQNLSKLADDLEAWLHRGRATNSLSDPLDVIQRTRTRPAPSRRSGRTGGCSPKTGPGPRNRD